MEWSRWQPDHFDTKKEKVVSWASNKMASRKELGLTWVHPGCGDHIHGTLDMSWAQLESPVADVEASGILLELSPLQRVGQRKRQWRRSRWHGSKMVMARMRERHGQIRGRERIAGSVRAANSAFKFSITRNWKTCAVGQHEAGGNTKRPSRWRLCLVTWDVS